VQLTNRRLVGRWCGKTRAQYLPRNVKLTLAFNGEMPLEKNAVVVRDFGG